MPVSPFEPDAAPRQPAEGRSEQRYDTVVRPEVRLSAADRDKEQGADETIEEPGYGHGV
jgi:hypothetical protein